MSSPNLIDFETLPDGTDTQEYQQISDQYEGFYGVTFKVKHKVTEEEFNPIIVEAGEPSAAFEGCYGIDKPYDGQGLGSRFLGFPEACMGSLYVDLIITYSEPVSEASGVLIDVDSRD